MKTSTSFTREGVSRVYLSHTPWRICCALPLLRLLMLLLLLFVEVVRDEGVVLLVDLIVGAEDEEVVPFSDDEVECGGFEDTAVEGLALFATTSGLAAAGEKERFAVDAVAGVRFGGIFVCCLFVFLGGVLCTLLFYRQCLLLLILLSFFLSFLESTRIMCCSSFYFVFVTRGVHRWTP